MMHSNEPNYKYLMNIEHIDNDSMNEHPDVAENSLAFIFYGISHGKHRHH